MFPSHSSRRVLTSLSLLSFALAWACDGDHRAPSPTAPFVHPGPNPAWEATAEQAANAVFGATAWALESAGSIEGLGTWSSATGFWSVVTTLTGGESVELRIQYRNGDGRAQKHYVASTTAEIDCEGTVTGPGATVGFQMVAAELDPAHARALARGGGSVAAGGTPAVPFNAGLQYFGCGVDLCGANGGMLLSFGAENLNLSFYGLNVVGVYYYLGGFNEFSFLLHPLPHPG